ncbi:MAG: helix-turn-helix transcriptional regulator [Anaerolineaceae bacterium]|nr:helix-turn-helix transcriptional regulator [Anaerolineaceae bacterium]
MIKIKKINQQSLNWAAQNHYDKTIMETGVNTMAESLGTRIAELRRAKGITQEEMAGKLNVSPQAVSKWENDISCPDIMALPQIAKMLGTSVDELLSGHSKPEIQLLPEEKRKNPDDLIFRIIVNSSDGDKVRVNLPVPLIRMGLQLGMKMPQISGNDVLKDVDLSELMGMVDKGLIGKLVEVESADGDIVDILVE